MGTGQRIKSCSRRSGVAFIQIRRPGSADLLRERPCAIAKPTRGNVPVLLLRIGSEWRYNRFRCLLILKYLSVEGALYRHSRNALLSEGRGGGAGVDAITRAKADMKLEDRRNPETATEASLRTRRRLTRAHRNRQPRQPRRQLIMALCCLGGGAGLACKYRSRPCKIASVNTHVNTRLH